MKLSRLVLTLILTTPAIYGSLSVQSSVSTTRVEVLGLRNWIVQMLESAVSRYAPGTTLADAACAIILRDSVGFPDATTFAITDEAGTQWRVAICVRLHGS